jgi:hypothetical protein
MQMADTAFVACGLLMSKLAFEDVVVAERLLTENKINLVERLIYNMSSTSHSRDNEAWLGRPA